MVPELQLYSWFWILFLYRAINLIDFIMIGFNDLVERDKRNTAIVML